MLVAESPLNQSVELQGKPVDIVLSKAANKALSQRTQPLNVEMELYFSCLIRKQVRFHDDRGCEEAISVNDRLCVNFRPVMTRVCGKDYEGDEPPLTDFPIANSRPYIPHWLHIDFRAGQWVGEFGYHTKG